VPQQRRLTLCLLASILTACSAMPAGSAYDAATVVYSAGASQHTVAVELPVAPADVYSSMTRIIEQLTDVKIVNRDEKTFVLEIIINEKQLTGQATDLGNGETLLFIWADAGMTGQSGEELALIAIEKICDELDVAYKLVKT
jgi:hypothetical protein